MPKIGGRLYRYMMGSDVDRDGMFLELEDATDEPALILEIFYSDRAADMTITTSRQEIPIEAVEWALKQARKRLPPSTE